MSDRKRTAGSALAAVPTVLLRHGLGGSRHAERKTHAHECRWVASVQEREGHDAGYREVSSAEANAARLGKCGHCGGGER